MSKSTDKLSLLTDLAKYVVRKLPGWVENISEIKLEWASVQVDVGNETHVAVPNVYIKFK